MKNDYYKISELIFREFLGELTEEEQNELQYWLDSDIANKKYREKLFTKYSLERVEKINCINTQLAWTKYNNKYSKRISLYSVLKYAAVVIFILSLGGLIYLSQDRETGKKQQVAELSDISQPGKPSAVLTLSTGEKIQLGENENKQINEKNNASIKIDSTNSIKYDTKEVTKEEVVYNTVTVPKSGEYSLVLSDGSKVWLNSETTIKYPIKFIGKKREVFLTGEAYFEVKKDASKPFIVHNEKANVRVLGTSFNVMSYKDEKKAEITLESGKVEVSKGEVVKRILPGQQAKVGEDIEGIAVRKVDTRYYTAWREGKFYFDNTELYDLTRKLSRWYNVEFFFEDSSLKELRFSGGVTKYRSIDYLLDLIEKTNNVNFRIKGKAIWISYRK